MNRREILEMPEVQELINLAYMQGFGDGIEAYAWMKNGTYFVGTTGQTLNEALKNIELHTTYTKDLAGKMLKQAQDAESWLAEHKK